MHTSHPDRPHAMRRPHLSLVGALVLLLWGQLAQATGGQVRIPVAEDFQADVKTIAGERIALLVAVTREGCPYCARLKREILLPMLKSGEYEGKVVMRELIIEPESSVVDFEGQALSSADVAARYSVEITPTVLLLDHTGRSLHPPITGINTAEMYGYYLDRAIDRALNALSGGQSTIKAQE